VRNRRGYGKAGKRKAAFQLSHSHDYYEIRSVMGYGFKGQGHDSEYRSLIPLVKTVAESDPSRTGKRLFFEEERFVP
jgi:hypothetical protein